MFFFKEATYILFEMKSIKFKLSKENKSCKVDYTLPLPNEKCLSDYIFFSKNKFSSQHIIFYCHYEKNSVFPYDCTKVINIGNVATNI